MTRQGSAPGTSELTRGAHIHGVQDGFPVFGFLLTP